MDKYDRPASAERGDSLLRLRTVTTAVAVAGVAATVGFGFVAAGGYRGTDTSNDGSTTANDGSTTANDPAGAGAPQDQIQQAAPGVDGSSSGGQQQVIPQDNGTAPQNNGTAPQVPKGGLAAPAPQAPAAAQPPPRSSSRRGHASTGASG